MITRMSQIFHTHQTRQPQKRLMVHDSNGGSKSQNNLFAKKKKKKIPQQPKSDPSCQNEYNTNETTFDALAEVE